MSIVWSPRSPRNARPRRPTNAALARRLGRKPARLTEFERDLANVPIRIALLVTIGDALDLGPVLVPVQHLEGIARLRGSVSSAWPAPAPCNTTFCDIF